jgi:hypothetical protein
MMMACAMALLMPNVNHGGSPYLEIGAVGLHYPSVPRTELYPATLVQRVLQPCFIPG